MSKPRTAAIGASGREPDQQRCPLYFRSLGILVAIEPLETVDIHHQSVVRDDQPDAREGQAGRAGVAERFVWPVKPGNAGGGKGPQFKAGARRSFGAPEKIRTPAPWLRSLVLIGTSQVVLLVDGLDFSSSRSIAWRRATIGATWFPGVLLHPAGRWPLAGSCR
jgi:hypothetical protein